MRFRTTLAPLLALLLAPLLVAAAAHAETAEPFRTGAPLFVAPETLPATLNRKGVDVAILDVRPDADFRRGHLPRAQSLKWEQTRAGVFERGSLIGGKLPEDLSALVRTFAVHGVRLDRPVLVCGAPNSGWGEEGRVAWALQYLGHSRVFILDGGCGASALATETETKRVAGKMWAPKLKSQMRALKNDVRRAVALEENIAPQILDVRTREEYDGATPYFEARGGHIQRARHLHYSDLLDDNGRVLSNASVRAKLAAAGLDPSRPVIAYCTGGVRSAWASLVLQRAGVATANYDGSMWEWAADASLPMTDPSAASVPVVGASK